MGVIMNTFDSLRSLSMSRVIFALLFSLVSFVKLSAAEVKQETSLAELKAIHSILGEKCRKYPNKPTAQLAKEIMFLLDVFNNSIYVANVSIQEKKNYYNLIGQIIQNNNDLVIRHLKVRCPKGYNLEDEEDQKVIEGVKEEIRSYLTTNFPTTANVITAQAKYLETVQEESKDQDSDSDSISSSSSSILAPEPKVPTTFINVKHAMNALNSVSVRLSSSSSVTVEDVTGSETPRGASHDQIFPQMLPFDDQFSLYNNSNPSTASSSSASNVTGTHAGARVEVNKIFGANGTVIGTSIDIKGGPAAVVYNKSSVPAAPSNFGKYARSFVALCASAGLLKASTTELLKQDPRFAKAAQVASVASAGYAFYNALTK